MQILGLAIAIISVALAVFFYVSPVPPAPLPTRPIPTSSGGENPTRLFNGRRSAYVQSTKLVLYSLNAVVNNAGPNIKGRGVVMVIGNPMAPGAYCASSYVLRRPGAYRCVIQTSAYNTIADPCFGVDARQVECQLPDGEIGLVGVFNPVHPRPYHPSLSEVGRQYPWHLELANGLNCSWNWLPFRGHHDGGWICAEPLASIEFLAARSGKLLNGPGALNYTSALIMGTHFIYYAEDLAQGTRNTWSVLLEDPGNPGVFRREQITQAWY
jgi:hypothetical protein